MATNDYKDEVLDEHGKEPATKHDVTEGGVLGAVGGAIVGGLAGGPVGALIGAIAGGAASAAAVDVVDKHDHDYARTVAGSDAPVANTIRPVDTYSTPSAANTVPTPVAAARVEDYSATAATPTDTLARTDAVDTDGKTVIPVIEEELEVGKRQVQSGGARVHTEVIETPVEENVTLHEEHVVVDRRPVDRAVSSADNAFQDGVIELTETDEVPVVAKTARVVEEVVIGKTATDRVETIHDTVRRTDVEVEELEAERDLKR
ncbi:hypothetical protein CCAX7_26140 [Capsulimonas corticalis]|uniref:DUF2382 domain-containing protein n=1 Tax=Capsulimonas corticalis TaxID=2219043 RepID=A0A9N7L4A3_9BACT|nr:YsnF/AvaK domain-containing protein [Capsulimonas corticalis]BDI30563.1 hypothetical protein CCAX7_26140 [Capsulimonas corticalis]